MARFRRRGFPRRSVRFRRRRRSSPGKRMARYRGQRVGIRM